MTSCLYFIFLLLYRSLAKARPSSEEGLSQQEKGQADMEFIAKSGVCVCLSVCMSTYLCVWAYSHMFIN